MKLQDFQIRDPYIVLEKGDYYMFGTAGNDLWGQGWDFSIYKSADLVDWQRIENAVRLPRDFWADKEFWAPEVYRWGGKFVMFMTCMKSGLNRGTHTFISDRIDGPFVPAAPLPVTPRELMCLDGTLYVDPEGAPYMVFSHEWLQAGNGAYMAGRLNDSLTALVEKPKTLFTVRETGWCREIDFQGAVGYPSDGPQIYTCANGDLLLLWSSLGPKGYFTATARSKSGIYGPFRPEKLLYDRDGGHSMIFRDKSGAMKFAFHSPNDIPGERARIVGIVERGNDLFVAE
ncbi:MAG: family 43 glycosylhydrolase [Clostridiales bacterium]|jgi:beta-xylosidase|nr:family 43 glycosylhydrolase [Clostridiales bacterium]